MFQLAKPEKVLLIPFPFGELDAKKCGNSDMTSVPKLEWYGGVSMTSSLIWNHLLPLSHKGIAIYVKYFSLDWLIAEHFHMIIAIYNNLPGHEPYEEVD